MNNHQDQVSRIMAYEQGELSEQDTIKLFQELLDSGLVWKLQGHYGRAAQSLLTAGLIKEQVREG